MRYGYESPEAFSKAFRRIHGISPSIAKKNSQPLKAYPKLSFQIQLKGDVEMDYKIVEKEMFAVVGKSIRTTIINGENQRSISNFWNESNRNGFSEELAKNSGPLGLIGICLDFDKQQENLTYLIGAEKDVQNIPSDWEERQTDPCCELGCFSSPWRNARCDAESVGKNLLRMVPFNRIRACWWTRNGSVFK